MWWLQQLVMVLVLGTIVMLTTTTTTVRAVTHSTPHPAAATTRRPWPDSGYGPTPSPRDVHNSASSQPSPGNATTNNTSSSDSNQRSNRSNSVSGLDFSCPAQMCDCYVLRPELKIWLNCTVPRLQGTEQQRALFRAIPAQGSAIMTITCSTPARSYLYNDMISQLSFLEQLNIVNCKFHDIPKDVFRGLDLLEIMFIDGANLLGHVDPEFASHLPLLRLLEIIRSRVTFLPPLCRSSNLRTLNVSYNHIADFDHAGVHCVSSPLSKLEILDVNYNDVSSIPAWLGRSVPNLIRLSSGDNAIREVGAELCGELPSLGFLDLSFNALHDVGRVELANCSQLSILALAANPLGALPPRSVESMPSLQHLYLFSMGLNDNVWDKLSHLKHLKHLDLHNNSLVTVPPLVMREFPSLETLNLSANSIASLPKKALVDQYGLRSLDLSGNGMQQLPRQAFGNLWNLLELRLSNNSISDVDQTTFTGLRALVMLNFSHNDLSSIPEESFATMSSLQTLDLSHNRLADISPTAFTRMGSLVRVFLAHNRLQAIHTMSGLYSLEEVDLSFNNLTYLPSAMFTGLQNLTVVTLRGNGLSSLSTKTFHDCRSLRHLDLSHNSLAALSSMHFVNVVNLVYLDLSYNQIGNIGTTFQSLKLRTLLLRHNSMHKLLRGEVSSSLEELDVSHNQISHVSPFTFAAAVSLRQVNLTFNELTSLSANTMEISFSQVQHAQPVFYLRGNPMRCDCDLGWLKEWSLGNIPSSEIPLPIFGDVESLLCHASNRSRSVALTSLRTRDFLCAYSRKCGDRCPCCGFDMCYCNSVCPRQCTCHIGHSRLKVNRVDCSNADLDSLPGATLPEAATEIFMDGNALGTLEALSFLGHGYTVLLRLNHSDLHHIENNTFRGMKSLEVLHLDHNFLTLIFAEIFRDLVNLEELYLQDNEITFVEQGSFSLMNKLRVLNLERNMLVTFAFTDFNLAADFSALHLRDNPWTCGGNFTCHFFRFLVNSSAVVKDLKHLKCYDYDARQIPENRVTNGTPVLSLPLDRCGDGVNVTELTSLNVTRPSTQSLTSGQEVSLLIAVSVVSVLVITGLVVIYINRHLLEVWCFTKFGWRVFKMAPGGAAEDADRPYDAFVSYSNLDEEFVVRELAPRLENGFKRFKLCLHYRDFPVGASIAETIVRSVESSKRTIILVSHNFLASEWCKFEFQTAHQQVLTERRNRVILVLLHDIDEAKLDQTLKLYMRTRTYLKYDDPWFWEKLLFAMPDKKEEKFERLPSTRDLDYVARFGRSPSKTPASTPALVARNGHVNTGADMGHPDMYEVPVEGSGTYERVNESMSLSGSLYTGGSVYTGGSISTGSGHYEEVTPRGFVLRPMQETCTCGTTQPPPLPPLPKMGLLSQEEVRLNSPRHSSREALSKNENWV